MAKSSISLSVMLAAALAVAVPLIAPPVAAQRPAQNAPKALEQEINQKLTAQKVRGVYVVVKNNVVILNGTATRFEHARAVRITRSVPGVGEIKDQVFIQ